MSHRLRRLARTVVILTVVAAALLSAAPAYAAAAAEPPVGLAFTSPRTTVRVGRTSVIALRLPQPAATDQQWQASVEGEPALEVIRQPAVLEGHSVAYLRVRGLREGEARIRVGAAALDVSVAPVAIEREPESRAPRLGGPAAGAAVWGRIAVGADVFFDPLTDSRDDVTVRLRLPDGTLIEPTGALTIETAPLRRLVFEVDTDALPPGPASLVAVAERAGASGEAARESAPLPLLVIKPAEGAVTAGECEAHLDPPRPLPPNIAPIRVGSDPVASGGRYVVNASAEPAWCFPFEAAEPGLYQVMAVARGDYGGGALPSVGVALGESDRAATASRLVDTRWHRVPVGTPIALEAGKQTISVRFLNDLYAPNYSDRNLFLDRYEIVRLDTTPSEGTGEGDAAAGDAMMAMTGAPMAAMMMMSPGGAGVDDGSLRVALFRPVHGLPLQGDLLLQGQCWWQGAKESDPPRVELLINGQPAMSQWAPDPIFRVNPGYFRAGVNTLQLAASLPDGRRAVTPLQELRVAETAVQEAAPRQYLRFSVLDRDAWDDSLRELLTQEQRPEGLRTLRFSTNGSATLNLPEDLEGEYELWLEARGEQFEGSPIAAVTLEAGDAKTPVGEQNVPQWWNDLKVGTVTLAKGPKRVVVAFTNDLHKEGGGDRNLWVKAVSLRTPPPGREADRTPPSLRLLYPREGHTAHGADAVVAEVSDNDALAWVDLFVNGQRIGANADLDPAVGRTVMPLLLRDLPPGTHRVKLRAEDRAGNQGESEEVSITVLPEPPAELGRYERAVRLLDRFAFGPAAQELADVLVMGERAYLEDRLSRPLDDPGDRAAFGRAAITFPQAGGYHEVGQRVIQHLELTTNPVRGRFVLWSQNHFSTWVRKTEPWRKWHEHEAFDRLGVAPFGDLLFASASSPAMLVYLDQHRSFASRLNENYAREVMELHTLGVRGGYTQGDVTALAGVLNGWMLADEASPDGRGYPLGSEFCYDPMLHDGQPRRVIGMAFDAGDAALRYDQVRLALETLAAHPSTAEHVARQLAEHYVAAPAPDALVADLAAVFRETGGDMKAMLLAIAQHPALWSRDLPLKVARPIDFAIRTARVTRAEDTWPIQHFLDQSGMGMFDCVTPNGYPEADERYADSNAVLQRWKLAKAWEWRLSTLIPGGWRWREGDSPPQWRQRVVDALAVRLTGRLLGETSNEAALKVLEESAAPINEKMMQIAAFVAALPEASLR